MQMPSSATMTAKGRAESIAACWRAARPPAKKRTIAVVPVSAPQTVSTQRLGSSVPREVSMLSTKVFASAPETK